MQNGTQRRRLTTMEHGDQSVRHSARVGAESGGPRGQGGLKLRGTSSGNVYLSLTQRIGMDLRDTTWMEQANCLDKDPELFFPEHGGLNSEVRECCNACPVRSECLEYGRKEEFGVWGGTSYSSRQKSGELRKGYCAGECGNRLANNTTVEYCAWCDPDPRRGVRRRTKILQERQRREGKPVTATVRPSPTEATVAGILRGIEALGEAATRPKLYARLAANRRPYFEQAMLQLENRLTEHEGVISLS